MTELFDFEDTKVWAPQECKTSGALHHYLRTCPEMDKQLFVDNVKEWDKMWSHRKPVLIADIEPTMCDYKGFTHRSQVRGVTGAHKIKDNPICQTIRHYLDSGYNVRVFISSEDSAHPDTCAIYAFKERTLLEDGE